MAELALVKTHPTYTTKDFLDLFGNDHFFRLFGDKEDSDIPIKTFPHVPSNLDGFLSKMNRANRDGYGVFFLPNKSGNGSAKDDDITEIRALFLDLDGAPLQPVLDAGFEPSAILETSPERFHCYWLLSGNLPVNDFTRYQKALAKRFNGDESVSNKARLMRCPGFLHQKYDTPYQSQILSLNGNRYTPQQIVEGLGLVLESCDVAPEVPNKGETSGGKIGKGNRDNYIYQRSAALHKAGWAYEAVLAAALAENELRCEPPLPKAVVEKKVKSAAKKRKGKTNKLTAFKIVSNCVQGTGWEFFLDQNDNVYAYVQINGHHENVEVDSSQFRSLLRLEVKKAYDCGASRDAIEQFLGVIKGELIHNPVRRDVFQRVGRVGDKILVDSGRADWKVYEIDRDGWRLTNPEINPFIRSEKFRAYECDESTPRADWNDVFDLLGVTNTETQEIIKIWEATALISDIQRPGLVIYGPPGGGKTILTSFLRQVVDPSQQPVERFPRNDVRSLELKLYKNFIPAFDNLNTIDQETSDIMCQVATGALFDSRKLFSDSETVSRYMMKPWILNGVGVPGTAADFLSRVFLVKVECIPQKRRKAKEIIERQLSQLIPGIQAWVFDCISQGLRKIPYVKTEGFERMADCHRYSLAMASKLDMSDDDIDARWKANTEEQNSTAASGDILADLIPEFIEAQENHTWTGTASELLQVLHHYYNPDRQSYAKTFPKAANTLSRRLNHLQALLAAHGIDITTGRGEFSRTLTISRVEDVFENAKVAI